jgi:hypothetical protein
MGLGHCCSSQQILKSYPHTFTTRAPRAALTSRSRPQLESALRRAPACAAQNDQQEQLQTKSRADSLEDIGKVNSTPPGESSSDSSQGGLNRLLVLGGLVAAAAAIITAAGGVDGLKDKVHVSTRSKVPATLWLGLQFIICAAPVLTTQHGVPRLMSSCLSCVCRTWKT